MLTIAKVGSDRASYYLSTTAVGADHQGGLVEADGVWIGGQASALGLAGMAEPAAVRALLAGRSPIDGERLLSRPDRRRLTAYDCTFSTPKSVSVLFALGRPEVAEQIRLAHEGAVAGSLCYLERHGVCVRDGQLDGHTRLSKADGGLIAVAWLHRSSRAPDPHLHTHVLIANLARHHSGEWRPLDARDIYAELRTAAALFETHLRGELTARLGLGWRELNGVWSDVEGSDQRVLRAFSQRSSQIAAELSESGLKGPAAARLIAEVTRPPKDVTTPYSHLVETWRRRAHEEGLSAAHLASMLGRANRHLVEQREWEGPTLTAAAAGSADGTFTRRQLIQARCAAAPAGCDADAVERDVDSLLASPRLLARGPVTAGQGVRLKSGAPPPPRPEVRYTTAELIAMEDRLVAAFAERPSQVTVITYRAGGRAGALDDLSNAAAAWSAEQREVIAVAPGWRAATSFEAATGIESVSMRPLTPSGFTAFTAPSGAVSAWGGPMPTRPARLLPELPPGGILVIGDAHCFSTGVLEEALRHTRARSTELVMFGPARGFAERGVLTGVARAATGRPPELSGATGTTGTTGTGLLPDVVLRRRFGDVGAVVTTSLGAAVAEVVREVEGARPGLVFVVAGDHSIVKHLREVTPLPAAMVLHANDLDAVIGSVPGGGAPKPRLLVVGGAAALHAGATRLASLDRRHVLVIPPAFQLSRRERAAGLDYVLGTTAEACRPHYLTAELGAPRRDRDERAAWRSSAAMIEAFRDRWSVTDPRNPFGSARDAGPGYEDWKHERQQVRDGLHDRELVRELGATRVEGLELGR